MRWLTSIPLLLILLTALPSTAEAYIDPGAGSILIQAILGGAAGLAVLWRMYSKRLGERLRQRPADDRTERLERT